MRQKRGRILQSGTVVAVHFFPLRSTHATTQHNSGAKDIIRVRLFFYLSIFRQLHFFMYTTASPIRRKSACRTLEETLERQPQCLHAVSGQGRC